MAEAISDGDYGRAAITPTTAIAGRRGQWEIVYTVGKCGIREGGGIRITTPRKGLDRWEMGKVTAFCDTPDVTLEVVTEKSDPPTYHHSNYEAADVIVYGGHLESGSRVRVLLGSTGGYVSGRFVMALAQTHASKASFHVYVDPQGNGRFSRERTREEAYQEVEGPLTVDVKPGPAARIRCTVRSAPAPGQDLIGVVAVEDALENTIAEGAFDVVLHNEFGSVEAPAEVRKGRGKQGVRFRVKAPDEGVAYLGASCWQQQAYGVSNPVAPGFLSGGKQIYFGDLHVMTGSMGNPFMDGTTEGGLRYARDVFGMDFCGITNSIRPDRWHEDREVFRAYNEDHAFVTMPAYENGFVTGHKNVYFREEPEAVTRARSAEEMWRILTGKACTVISHHTNVPSETDPIRAWGPEDLSTINPRFERLIEICQNRGSFEHDQTGGEVAFGGYGSSIRDALALGLRLGFVGGTDTHRGLPGLPFSSPAGKDARSDPTGGMTAVMAMELTREAIWDALMARRCYATTSVRMLLDFSVNGLEMGTERRITASNRGRFRRRDLSVHAIGVGPLARAVVVRNGVEVYEEMLSGMEAEVRWEDPESLAKIRNKGIRGAYYYAKVYQQDGNVAWSSPVWLTYG